MSIINELRGLAPDRALEDHEARHIAERQATRLLALTGTTEPAVPAEIITELPRIQAQLATDLPASGATRWVGGRWQVLIRAEDHRLRRRFTLAHELKHIVDHPIVDRAYTTDSNRTAHERAEAICDYFAACLLMPRPWVKRAWTAGLQGERDLAILFYVSRQAMRIRLNQLGLTAAAMRCRRDGDDRSRPTSFRRLATLEGR